MLVHTYTHTHTPWVLYSHPSGLLIYVAFIFLEKVIDFSGGYLNGENFVRFDM